MEGVEEEAVEGMGTGAGREVGLAEASLMDLALALDSERAAASWASFSLDLRIRRRVLMIEEEEQATGVSEGGELKSKGQETHFITWLTACRRTASRTFSLSARPSRER